MISTSEIITSEKSTRQNATTALIVVNRTESLRIMNAVQATPATRSACLEGILGQAICCVVAQDPTVAVNLYSE